MEDDVIENTSSISMTTDTSSPVPVWIAPPVTTTGYSSTWVYTNAPSTNMSTPYYYSPIGINKHLKDNGYKIMQMPIDMMPKMVYLNGRLLTFGVFGSEAEYSYVPKSSLLFKNGVVGNAVVYNNTITISLQYEEKIYYYMLNDSRKTILDTKLLSEVKL